jgi:hypothetical protein
LEAADAAVWKNERRHTSEITAVLVDIAMEPRNTREFGTSSSR